MVPIFKKGKKSNASSYRPISWSISGYRIKPKQFKGGHFENALGWMEQFQRCSEHFNWTEREQILAYSDNLVEEASQGFLGLKPEVKGSIAKFKKSLQRSLFWRRSRLYMGGVVRKKEAAAF